MPTAVSATVVTSTVGRLLESLRHELRQRALHCSALAVCGSLMLMMLASSGWALLPCLKTGLLVGQSKNRQDFVRVLYAIGS